MSENKSKLVLEMLRKRRNKKIIFWLKSSFIIGVVFYVYITYFDTEGSSYRSVITGGKDLLVKLNIISKPSNDFSLANDKEKQSNLTSKADVKKLEDLEIKMLYDKKDKIEFENHKDSENEFIWRESEEYTEIKSSFEIKRDSICSGGKYLTQRMWNGCLSYGQGSAMYEIVIKKSGDYGLWSLVNWESGCSNLFILNVEDAKGKAILPYRREKKTVLYTKTKWRSTHIGKDNNFNNWHWIGNHIYKLEKGKYKFKYSVGLNGSSIDKFLLTDKLEYKPNLASRAINTNMCFYCSGELPYERISGTWERKKRGLHCSRKERGLIITGETWWKNYQISFLCSSPFVGSGGVLFYYQDEKNYYYLSLSQTEQILYKVLNGKRTELLKNLEELKSAAEFAEYGKYLKENDEEKLLKAQETSKLKIKEFAELLLEEYDSSKYKTRKVYDRNKGKVKRKLLKEQSLLKRLESKKFKDYVTKPSSTRITIGNFNNRIQLFINGKKLKEIEDKTFSNGLVGFISEKAVGYSIKDMSIYSISQLGEHENISNPQENCRIITSVMDHTASMGGMHPGDHSVLRSDSDLRAFIENKLKIKCDKLSTLLDYQWLNFEREIFQEQNGNGNGKGFIKYKAVDDNGHILFSNMTLSGNWEFEYQIQGTIEEFGLCLKDEFDNVVNSDYALLRYSVNDKKIKARQKFDIKQSAYILDWDEEKIYDIKYIKKGNDIEFLIDGEKVCIYRNIKGIELSRPGLYIRNGKGILDNIESKVKADLFYNFTYNQAWTLSLSDFETEYEKQGHGGNYYSYITLKDAGKNDIEPSLITKRKFKGDISVLLKIENDSRYFDINLESQSGKSSLFRLEEYGVIYYENGEEKKKEPMSGFNADKRRLIFVRLIVKNGIARLYSTDSLGSQRLLIKERINIGETDIFKLQLKGKPNLKIKNILIWGNEIR